MFKIDMSDLVDKLAALPDLTPLIANAVADEAVLPELSKYPTQRGRKVPFKSDKARRYFFVALKRGQITVPYIRTGNAGLTSSWPKAQTANGLTLTAAFSYSDLLRSAGKQSAVFAGIWPTDEDVAEKVQDDLAEVIGTATVIKALQDAGLA